MEENNTTIKNAIVSFIRPLRLDRITIYGVILDKTKMENLADYVSYLKAAELFLSNGGKVKNNKNTWTFDEYEISVNGGFRNLLASLFGRDTRYIIDYFDEPLEYTKEEVDDDCFILSEDFIERYTDLKYQIKTVSNDEENGSQD